VNIDWDHRRWEVAGLPSAVRSIALSSFFDCLSLEDGTVWCWGSNELGELGMSAPKTSMMPVQLELKGAAVEIAGGTFHACARMRDGSVWCWGRNDKGQVSASAASSEILGPTRVALDGSADQIAAGADATCAILHDGAVWCWGEIGITYQRSPPTKLALPAAATQIAIGNQSGCAVLVDGSPWCWGGNRDGQLGYDDHCSAYPEPTICDTAPPRQVSLREPAIAIAMGDSHACAVLRGGQADCWGDGYSGELGRGAKTSSWKPAPTR